MQFGYIRIRSFGTSLLKQKTALQGLGTFEHELTALAELERIVDHFPTGRMIAMLDPDDQLIYGVVVDHNKHEPINNPASSAVWSVELHLYGGASPIEVRMDEVVLPKEEADPAGLFRLITDDDGTILMDGELQGQRVPEDVKKELHAFIKSEDALKAGASFTDLNQERLAIDDPKPGRHALQADHLIARKEVLSRLSKGDELVVADYPTVFLSPTDAMAVIEHIAKCGATLFVLEDNTRYHWGGAEQAIAAELATIAQKTHKAVTDERMQKARVSRKKLGHMGGRPRTIDEKALKAAKKDWANPNKGTAQQIADKRGIPRTTLIRLLGPISEARKGK